MYQWKSQQLHHIFKRKFNLEKFTSWYTARWICFVENIPGRFFGIIFMDLMYQNREIALQGSEDGLKLQIFGLGFEKYYTNTPVKTIAKQTGISLFTTLGIRYIKHWIISTGYLSQAISDSLHKRVFSFRNNIKFKNNF